MSSLRSWWGFCVKNIMPLVLIPLLVLIAATSLYRFVILQDYMVTYEIDCDPETENCFLGCDDDECTEIYFYAEVERHATEIYEVCGGNVLDCDAAYECSDIDPQCMISYCTNTDNQCVTATSPEYLESLAEGFNQDDV